MKEELAVVDFLTAKSNVARTSKPNTAHCYHQTDDQTPVDLLLGLAKTRSGKRAAEEEQRQLRSQQHREREEQKAAARIGMTSPWGYVAPHMPGLEVQQPFGNNASKKVPRPLQPPPPRRPHSSTDWSPDLLESIMRPPSVKSGDQTPSLTSELNGYTSFPLSSPYRSISDVPMLSPGQQMLTQPPELDGLPFFGNGSSDGLNMADFKLGQPEATAESGQFNPFALAQIVDKG